MRRALQLARLGEGYTSPNPMVGAVIVRERTIIGEGYHRRCGEGHAEVNAVASVSDKSLLRDCTMYVTLEPCSHYGKTPPCAKLIIDMGIPRVVVGCGDPDERVRGRGIAMLRHAGVEVIAGVLREECEALNVRFITAHRSRRPYVMLKWAQSADGYLDCLRSAGDEPMKFSSALGQQAVHSLRSRYDAIMVGGGTVLADNPRLDVRLIDCRSPRRVVLDRRGIVPAAANVMADGTLYFCSVERADLPAGVTHVACSPTAEVREVLYSLRSLGITSVLVEGGATLLKAFVESGMWDDSRVEVARVRLGTAGAAPMVMPRGVVRISRSDDNEIVDIRNANPVF